MQLLFPYDAPAKIAEMLTDSDLNFYIAALKKAVQSSDGKEKEWYDRCRVCMELYRDKHFSQAQWWSEHAGFVKPEWLTPARCASDRRKMAQMYSKKYGKHDGSGDARKAEEA